MTRETLLHKLTWFGIAAALLATTVTSAAAQTENALVGAYAGTTVQTPVSGTSTVIIDMTVVGSANALGPFTAVGQQTVNIRTGTYTGTYTFRVANGDTLTATSVGIRHLCVSPGAYSLEETFTITGGTGAFSGATGAAVGLGAFGKYADQIALVFSGTLR